MVDERLGEFESRGPRPGQGRLPFCLKLDQRKKTGFSDWLTQAKLFYANLLANPDDLAAMGRFRITKEFKTIAKIALADDSQLLEALQFEAVA